MTPAMAGPIPKPAVMVTAAVRGPDLLPSRRAHSTSQALPTLKVAPAPAPWTSRTTYSSSSLSWAPT
jgi:hypothetical protein